MPTPHEAAMAALISTRLYPMAPLSALPKRKEPHWRLLIGIDPDHTAYLVLTDAALATLCDRTGINYEEVVADAYQHPA